MDIINKPEKMPITLLVWENNTTEVQQRKSVNIASVQYPNTDHIQAYMRARCVDIQENINAVVVDGGGLGH